MSNKSDSTRDWLLKKLLKASRNLAEQQDEINELKTKVREGAESRSRLITEGQDNERRLLERIHQMAPEKQFQVRFQSFGKSIVLKPIAISSSNGVTTITVERA